MKLILASKSGQLCNRLFAFSHFIVNAIEYNYELYNPNFDEYCQYFKSTLQDDFEEYPITVHDQRFSYFRLEGPGKKSRGKKMVNLLYSYISPYHRILYTRKRYDLRSDAFLKLLEKEQLIVAYGWGFRDFVGFKKYSSQLKRFFQPIEEHKDNVARHILDCRKEQTILVGVHIRRRDYRTFAKGQCYYDDSVYLSKMREIQNLFNQKGKAVAFLICSDEPLNNDFAGFETYRGTGHFIEDLYCLAECDYLIGPPSTYSGWASFYGDVPRLQIKTPDQVIRLEEFTISQG